MSASNAPVLGGWDLVNKLKADNLALGDQFTAPQPQPDESIGNWYKALSSDMKTKVGQTLASKGLSDGEVFNGWTSDQIAAVTAHWQAMQQAAPKRTGLISGALAGL